METPKTATESTSGRRGGEVDTRFGAWKWAANFFLIGDRQGRNTAMEGLRGYAVLLVFFVHAAGIYLTEWRHVQLNDHANHSLLELRGQLARTDLVLMFLQNSHHGVDLFFLLSGFLIARILLKSGADFSYREFLWKRFLRIYPTFLLSMLVVTYVRVSYLKWDPFLRGEFLKNLLLLVGCPNITVWAYNHVTWSLFYEAVFYLVFPALFFLLGLARREGTAGQPLGGALLLVSVILLNTWLPRFSGFFFGALVGLCPEKSLSRMARQLPTLSVLLAYFGVLVFFRVCTINLYSYYLPLFNLVSALLFVKTCFADGVLNRLFRLSPLRLLGNLSYSFYLIHALALSLGNRWFSAYLLPLNGRTQMLAFFALCFALTMTCSVALFCLSERWYFWYSRRAHRPRHSATDNPDAGGEILHFPPANVARTEVA